VNIVEQLEQILNEDNGGGSGGSQVGRLLFSRYMTTKDPNERQYLSFLSTLLVVSILTNDKGLFAKVKGGVNHPLKPS
jgi:hypothetical protein